jgi:hypothetical protein
MSLAVYHTVIRQLESVGKAQYRDLKFDLELNGADNGYLLIHHTTERPIRNVGETMNVMPGKYAIERKGMKFDMDIKEGNELVDLIKHSLDEGSSIRITLIDDPSEIDEFMYFHKEGEEIFCTSRIQYGGSKIDIRDYVMLIMLEQDDDLTAYRERMLARSSYPKPSGI